jgi:phosphatidylglycerophosphatase A
MRPRPSPGTAGSPPHVTRVDPSPIVDRLSLGVATLAGIGRSPVAPGTMGSIAALPLAAGLTLTTLPVSLGFLAFLTPLAMLAAHRAGRLLGEPDASAIVVDELVGILATFVGLPFSWRTVALGFLLFRLFDVLKPWPANHFDRHWKNGAGVVFDDLAAGLWARFVLGYVALP